MRSDAFDESLYDEKIFLNDIFHQKEIYKDIVEKAKPSLFNFFDEDDGIEELLRFFDVGKDFENEYYFNGLDYYYPNNAPEGLKTFNPHIAYFFSLDFNNINTDSRWSKGIIEEVGNLKKKYEYVFNLGDQKGYNQFDKTLDKILSPFNKSDENVTQSLIKILTDANHYIGCKLDDEPSYLWSKHGYINGSLRRILEIMCEWPLKFLTKPDLVTIRPKTKIKDLQFQDLFVSAKAYKNCIEHLQEFFSEDGKIWIYKKSAKTAFIALKDVLRSKRYIEKNPSMEEWISVAKNSFGLEISSRTFKEYNSIREAYFLFKVLPSYK